MKSQWRYMNDQMWSTLKKVYSKIAFSEKQSGFQISRFQHSTSNSLNGVSCTLWKDLSKSFGCLMGNFLLKVLQSLVFTYTYYIWCEVIFAFVTIIFRAFSFNLAPLSLNICACDMFHGRNDVIPQDIPMKLFHVVVKFYWI